VNSRSAARSDLHLGGVAEEHFSTRDLARIALRRAARRKRPVFFHFPAAPLIQDNITIDGLDNNDDRAARERFTPSIEAIDEVRSSQSVAASMVARPAGA